MSDFSWMQVVDAGARALSTGSDGMTNAAIVERIRAIYGDIKANAGEESGWLKHYEAISIAADRIVILADAVRGDFECIGRLADERNAAREERDELRVIASKMTAERDEARRMCCEFAAMDESGYVKHGDMLHFAESRGWDCFQQEDNK